MGNSPIMRSSEIDENRRDYDIFGAVLLLSIMFGCKCALFGCLFAYLKEVIFQREEVTFPSLNHSKSVFNEKSSDLEFLDQIRCVLQTRGYPHHRE